MKKITRDGIEYFEFEPHEDDRRRLFESALLVSEAVPETFLEAALKAMQKATQDKLEAWDAMHEMLGTDPKKVDLTYNHLTRQVKVVPRATDKTEEL
jgi:hypothetical protein